VRACTGTVAGTIVRARLGRTLVVIGVAGSALAPDALSQEQTFTATAVMPVTIEIAASCRVRATDLSFGIYAGNSGTPLRGQTVIELICTRGLDVEIGLDAGQAPGATVQDRRMMSGTDALRYGLYQDAARGLNWGNTAGVDTAHAQGIGASQTVTVFGDVPPRQQVAPGQYGDIITVHVYF
jgi:spore coat protein U-like protein